MKKVKRCKVNGVLAWNGKFGAMCVHVGFGDKSACMAHGNKKCEHMVKTNKPISG